MAPEQVTLTGGQAPPKYECPYPKDDPVYEHYEQASTYGFMHASDYRWSNVECTKRAYGEGNNRSLMYHSEWMDVGETIQCLDALREVYPDTFNAGEVIDVLRDYPDARVVVGRECSPVIYVWTGAPRTLGRALNELDKPPEYGAEVYPDAETFPSICVGDPIDEIGFGEPSLLRAWWD